MHEPKNTLIPKVYNDWIIPYKDSVMHNHSYSQYSIIPLVRQQKLNWCIFGSLHQTQINALGFSLFFLNCMELKKCSLRAFFHLVIFLYLFIL